MPPKSTTPKTSKKRKPNLEQSPNSRQEFVAPDPKRVGSNKVTDCEPIVPLNLAFLTTRPKNESPAIKSLSNGVLDHEIQMLESYDRELSGFWNVQWFSTHAARLHYRTTMVGRILEEIGSCKKLTSKDCNELSELLRQARFDQIMTRILLEFQHVRVNWKIEAILAMVEYYFNFLHWHELIDVDIQQQPHVGLARQSVKPPLLGCIVGSLVIEGPPVDRSSIEATMAESLANLHATWIRAFAAHSLESGACGQGPYALLNQNLWRQDYINEQKEMCLKIKMYYQDLHSVNRGKLPDNVFTQMKVLLEDGSFYQGFYHISTHSGKNIYVYAHEAPDWNHYILDNPAAGVDPEAGRSIVEKQYSTIHPSNIAPTHPKTQDKQGIRLPQRFSGPQNPRELSTYIYIRDSRFISLYPIRRPKPVLFTEPPKFKPNRDAVFKPAYFDQSHQYTQYNMNYCVPGHDQNMDYRYSYADVFGLDSFGQPILPS